MESSPSKGRVKRDSPKVTILKFQRGVAKPHPEDRLSTHEIHFLRFSEEGVEKGVLLHELEEVKKKLEALQKEVISLNSRRQELEENLRIEKHRKTQSQSRARVLRHRRDQKKTSVMCQNSSIEIPFTCQGPHFCEHVKQVYQEVCREYLYIPRWQLSSIFTLVLKRLTRFSSWGEGKWKLPCTSTIYNWEQEDYQDIRVNTIQDLKKRQGTIQILCDESTMGGYKRISVMVTFIGLDNNFRSAHLGYLPVGRADAVTTHAAVTLILQRFDLDWSDIGLGASDGCAVFVGRKNGVWQMAGIPFLPCYIHCIQTANRNGIQDAFADVHDVLTRFSRIAQKHRGLLRSTLATARTCENIEDLFDAVTDINAGQDKLPHVPSFGEYVDSRWLSLLELCGVILANWDIWSAICQMDQFHTGKDAEKWTAFTDWAAQPTSRAKLYFLFTLYKIFHLPAMKWAEESGGRRAYEMRVMADTNMGNMQLLIHAAENADISNAAAPDTIQHSPETIEELVQHTLSFCAEEDREDMVRIMQTYATAAFNSLDKWLTCWTDPVKDDGVNTLYLAALGNPDLKSATQDLQMLWEEAGSDMIKASLQKLARDEETGAKAHAEMERWVRLTYSHSSAALGLGDFPSLSSIIRGIFDHAVIHTVDVERSFSVARLWLRRAPAMKPETLNQRAFFHFERRRKQKEETARKRTNDPSVRKRTTPHVLVRKRQQK